MKNSTLFSLLKKVNSLHVKINKKKFKLYNYEVGVEIEKNKRYKKKKNMVSSELHGQGWISPRSDGDKIHYNYLKRIQDTCRKVILNPTSTVRNNIRHSISSRETYKVVYGSPGESKNSGNYLNTCLPMIPDVRQMSVIKGLRDLTLSLFGINRYHRESSATILDGGPNGRANRYLRYQYKRLLSFIEAYPRSNGLESELKVFWNIDFLRNKYNQDPCIGFKFTKKDYGREDWNPDCRLYTGFPMCFTRYIQRLFPYVTSEYIKKHGTKWINSSIVREAWKMENKVYPSGNVNLILPKQELTKSHRRKIARQYWNQANYLIRNSKNYQIAVLHALLKKDRWYATMNVLDLWKEIATFKTQIKGWFQEVQMRRTWIESPPGKYRPLGIAPVSWRMNIKCHQIMLDSFVKGGVDREQHAYIKERGTGTFWRDFFSLKVYSYKYIYEYDFKGFFNNVKLSTVTNLLKDYGVPKVTTCMLLNYSGSHISPPDHKLITKIASSILEKSEFIYDFRRGYRYSGLPQGSGISPILSILCLIKLNALAKLKNPIYALKYADDGIFYSNFPINPIEILESLNFTEETGCLFQLTKCRWVKWNGKWLGNLKMLALVYDGVNNTLSASTRGNPNAKCVSTTGSKIPLEASQIISFPVEINSEELRKTVNSVNKRTDRIVIPLIKDGEILNYVELSNFEQEFERFYLNFNMSEKIYELKDKTNFVLPSSKLLKGSFIYNQIWKIRNSKIERDAEVSLTNEIEKKKELDRFWYTRENKLINIFNETQKGKHYQLWGWAPDPYVFVNPFFEKFNHGRTKPSLSLHIHPYINLGGRLEDNLKIGYKCKPKYWKSLSSISVENISFKTDPERGILREYLWFFALFATVNLLLNSFTELTFLVLAAILWRIFFVQEETIEKKRRYYCITLNHENTFPDKALFNFLVAGLYSGDLNPGQIEQDFSLRLHPKSMVGLNYKPYTRGFNRLTENEIIKKALGGSNLSFANLSSLGCALLSKYLAKVRIPVQAGCQVADNEIWLKTYTKLLNRLRDRRPGPSLIKPWARTSWYYYKKSNKLKNKLCKNLDDKTRNVYERKLEQSRRSHYENVMIQKQNMIPEFTRPFLDDPLNKGIGGVGLHEKAATNRDGKLLYSGKKLKKLLRYDVAVNQKIKKALQKGISYNILSQMFYSEHDRFWMSKEQPGLLDSRVYYGRRFILAERGFYWNTIIPPKTVGVNQEKVWTVSSTELLKKYGHQRIWHHNEWKNLLYLHDRLDTVKKPKKADWLTWEKKL